MSSEVMAITFAGDTVSRLRAASTSTREMSSSVMAPRHSTPTFVEIKKKYKGIVYKRRICMSAAAAQAFLRGMPYERAVRLYPLADPKAQAETTSPVSLQIAREIFAFCRRYGRLDPSMDIRVIRTAWKDRKSTRLNSSHPTTSRMPSSA